MTIRILHLEDDPVDAELIYELLASDGIDVAADRVVTERDFTQALERGGYDLVLSDFSLPGFDGVAGLRLARAKAPDTPFIFVSGTLGEEAAVDRLREGATDYVLKERLARLVPAVRRALRDTKERATLQRAEEALSGNERLLQAVLDSTPAVIYVKDLDGRYLYVNRRYEEAFGIDRSTIKGKTDFDLCPAEAAEAYRATELATIAAGHAVEVEEVTAGADGAHTFLSLKAPLLDANGKAYALCGVSTDITDRKRAEDKLRHSDAQVRTLAETVPCGLFILQGTKRIYSNRAFQEITGYTQSELRDQEFWDVIHPDFREAVKERGLARQSGVTFPSPYETVLLTKSGEERWVEVSATAIDFEGRPAAMGTASDITPRKRAEAELQRQKEALAQTEKLAAMGSLLAGVAHELNNPLSVVIGQVGLLRRTVSGKEAERAEKIGRAGERCARIVNNFLALARQRPTEKQSMSLPKVIAEAIELVAYPLRVDSVEVVTQMAADLPPIHADPHQVHQVVVNLVTNAHHALRGCEGPRTVTLKAYHAAPYIALEIEDTGPGVPPELRQRILEPFFTTKPPGEGTGLGLSLCKGIVEAHGGLLSVESGPGGGALFRVLLPLGAPSVAAVTAVKTAEATMTATRSRRILVVEDEAGLRELIAELLSAEGFDVTVAANGRRAIEALAGARFDLIVSDIRMPELDGPGLYRHLQERYPALAQRFLFLAGDSLDPATSRFLEETGRPRLEKPFSIEQAREAVRHALEAPL